MPSESSTKAVGLVVLSALMISFGYLFTLSGESTVALILLFIGVVLALVFASNVIHSKK